MEFSLFGYEDIQDESEAVETSGSSGWRHVKTASDGVQLKSFLFRLIIFSTLEKPLHVIHHVMILCSMACSSVKMRWTRFVGHMSMKKMKHILIDLPYWFDILESKTHIQGLKWDYVWAVCILFLGSFEHFAPGGWLVSAWRLIQEEGGRNNRQYLTRPRKGKELSCLIEE